VPSHVEWCAWRRAWYPSPSLLTSTIFVQVPPLPADVQKALERKRDASRKLSHNEYSI
jgi:hypothetical protein